MCTILFEVIQETAHLMSGDDTIANIGRTSSNQLINGLVESLNRMLKQILSKHKSKKGQNWDKMLGGAYCLPIQKYSTLKRCYPLTCNMAMILIKLPYASALDFQALVSK